MADNKQYITQEQEFGSVLISEDVIASIVDNAVKDVEGIVGLSVKPGADIAEKIGKKAWGKGIKIMISQDDAISIDCNVNIGYGQSVVTVAKAVQDVYAAVKEGEGIAAPLGKTKVFPEMVISMVEVGEETGKLPELLTKIADTYEDDVDNLVGALTSLIEPLMIVALAGIVGSIVIALFMPLTKIIEKLS